MLMKKKLLKTRELKKLKKSFYKFSIQSIQNILRQQTIL